MTSQVILPAAGQLNFELFLSLTCKNATKRKTISMKRLQNEKLMLLNLSYIFQGIVICNKKTKYLNLSRTFRKFKKCPRVLYFDSGPLIWPNDERGRINRFLNALHGGLMFGPLLLGRVEYL